MARVIRDEYPEADRVGRMKLLQVLAEAVKFEVERDFVKQFSHYGDVPESELVKYLKRFTRAVTSEYLNRLSDKPTNALIQTAVDYYYEVSTLEHFFGMYYAACKEMEIDVVRAIRRSVQTFSIRDVITFRLMLHKWNPSDIKAQLVQGQLLNSDQELMPIIAGILRNLIEVLKDSVEHRRGSYV